MNLRISHPAAGFYLGFLILFFACKKPSDSYIPSDPTGIDSFEFAYKVTGVKDLTMEQLDETEMKIAIQKTSFQSEEVGLNIPDLPKGLEVDYNPGYALASFPATLRFRAERVAPGVYPLVLETYSSHTAKQRFPFTLTISPYSNAAHAFHASFTASSACQTTGPSSHASFIEPVEGAHNQIRIRGFWTPSWKNEVIAQLHPESKTISIASQQVNQAIIEGTGTYSDDTLRLEYSVSTTVFVDYCQVVFSRD